MSNKKSNKKQKMKQLGTISHKTSTNKLIVPSKITPKIGSIIVNKQKKPIVKINDIIGSTKKPYISIKTSPKFRKAKVGEEVYLSTNKKRRRMRQRQAY